MVGRRWTAYLAMPMPALAGVYDRHAYAVEDQRIMEHIGSHFMALVEGRIADNVVNFSR
jgi:hypothetical protein